MDINKNKVGQIIENTHKQGKTTIIAKGVFDLVHPDHILFLKELKKFADKTIILIIPDQVVSQMKHGRPIQSQNSRVKVLRSIRYVDYCGADYNSTDVKTGIYSRDIDVQIMRELAPTKWALSPKNIKKFDGYNFRDIQLVQIDEGIQHSTTKIIDKIVKIYLNGKSKS